MVYYWAVRCHFSAGAVRSKKELFFFHMFWSHDLLFFLWISVAQLISQCLHGSVPPSPPLCLLGTSMSDKWNKYHSRYIDLAVLAAWKCITLNWKESKPPVIVHWWNELWSCLTLDNIYYRRKGRLRLFKHLAVSCRIWLEERPESV